MGSYAFIPFFIIPSIIVTAFLFKKLPETQNREIAEISKALRGDRRVVHPTSDIAMILKNVA
jgi:hypothetical protein